MLKAAGKIETDLAGRPHYDLLCNDRLHHGLDSLGFNDFCPTSWQSRTLLVHNLC